MAKRKAKATNKKVIYDCSDIDEIMTKAMKQVKDEIIPRIEIIKAANELMVARQKQVEKDVLENRKISQGVKEELDQILGKQDKIVANLQDTLSIIDKNIGQARDLALSNQRTLVDLSDHGTKLSQKIDDNLNHIKVNGSSVPLGEALQQMYQKHELTHKKIDELSALVEPIKAKRLWYSATKELIKKNGFLHFFFSTKAGLVLGTILLLLFINTIAVDVFGIKLDLISIFQAIAKIFGKTI